MLLALKHDIIQDKVSIKFITDIRTLPPRVRFNILINFLYPFINIEIIFSHASIVMEQFSVVIIYKPAAEPFSARN